MLVICDWCVESKCEYKDGVHIDENGECECCGKVLVEDDNESELLWSPFWHSVGGAVMGKGKGHKGKKYKGK